MIINSISSISNATSSSNSISNQIEQLQKQKIILVLPSGGTPQLRTPYGGNSNSMKGIFNGTSFDAKI